MGITPTEIKTTAKLLVGVGALAAAPGVGTAKAVVGVGASLMDLYAGRRAETGWEAKVTAALDGKLADPEFHRPAKADLLLPQLIEFGLPSPQDLTGEGWNADRIARLMRHRVPERSNDPAHANAALLDAFEAWVEAGLAPLLDDPVFVSGQSGAITREMFDRFDALEAGQDTTHEKLDEILRRMGGGGAALADPEALSLEELQTLAANFGEVDGASKTELVGFIETKRLEHAAFVAEINAINEQTAGLGNLKAAAKAAADNLDYAEVETLLARVDEVETEIAAQTKELRADNALLRGRVEDAYRLLSAAADSFGSVDALEPARRAIFSYGSKLRAHGFRYGGLGIKLSIDLRRRFVNERLYSSDSELWAEGQNNLGTALQEQGSLTGGEGGAALLGEAVAAYRAALRVRTEAAHPVAWAMTQNNLGNALRAQGARTGGEGGAALLGEAVAAYRAALRVRTEAAHPVAWAMTQNNLGTALRAQGSRMGGEGGAALLGEAVAAYRAALRVRTEAAHPVAWAGTQNNLGVALRNQGSRTGGEGGTALLGEAVAAYRAALRVRTEVDHPVDWAVTQNNLALALKEQLKLEDAKTALILWAEAVAACDAALRVNTREYHPVGWAMNHESAALCHEALGDHNGCGSRSQLYGLGLEAVGKSLEIYDPKHLAVRFQNARALKTRLEGKLAGLE